METFFAFGRRKFGAGRSPEEHRIFNKELTPLSSVAYGAPPSWGRGLLHFVMQQWRHKSQSRNADFIFIAEGDTFPSEPSEPSEPFEPFELGPLRGPWAIPQPSAQRAVKPLNLKNLRAKGPSTLTPKACPKGAPFDYFPL